MRPILLGSVLCAAMLGCSNDDSSAWNPSKDAGTAQEGGDAAAGAAGAAGSSPDASPSDAAGEAAPGVCDGVTCSGHGTCQPSDGGASCLCANGYHAAGLACEADETCAGVTCGRCAQCAVVVGKATCTCPAQMKPDGNQGCVVDPNPCDTTTCGADEYCVPEAHCSPLGACVKTCDCSNCPNCAPDNSDGRWDDWQEYCGAAPNQSPATMACTRPCGPGEGCIPYSPSICWPMEGCFSL